MCILLQNLLSFMARVERKKGAFEFESPNRWQLAVEPSYANIQVDDQVISVGPSLGWDWIWPNGISALFDVGPRWEVSKSRSLS